MAKPHYLSPLFSTLADVTGSGVALMVTLYPQTANTLHPQHPGLNCIDPGDSTLNVYNASDVSAMGAYLVGQGVSRIVFDWETTDTPGNRAVVLQILTGLRASGLRVDLWDVDPTNTDLADWKVANSDDDIHVVSYPLANDPAVWLTNTSGYVALAATRYGRTITLWIAPKSTEYPPGPPAPPPWGTYSETALRTYLAFVRDTPAVKAVVVWWAPSASGATAPWDASDAAWAVIREYAGSNVVADYELLIYQRLKAILQAHAPLATAIKAGNFVWYDGRLEDPELAQSGDPASYPKLALEPSGRTEQHWETGGRYGDHNVNATAASLARNKVIVFSYTIRITHRDLRLTMNSPTEAAAMTALRNSTPTMGVPGGAAGYAWVRGWGPLNVSRQMGPVDGEVGGASRMQSVIPVNVTTVFNSADLLA